MPPVAGMWLMASSGRIGFALRTVQEFVEADAEDGQDGRLPEGLRVHDLIEIHHGKLVVGHVLFLHA